jgi:hypothetical protein
MTIWRGALKLPTNIGGRGMLRVLDVKQFMEQAKLGVVADVISIA